MKNIKTFEEYSINESTEISIEQKVNQIINQIPSRTREIAVSDELKDVIKKAITNNSELAKGLKKMYATVGGRYKTKESMLNATKSYLNSTQHQSNFSKSNIKKLIKDDDLNVDIIYDKGDILVIKILDFKAAEILGSRSWDISNDKIYYDVYKDNINFIYDFSKDVNDKDSLMGTAYIKKLNIYYRDNSLVKNVDKLLQDLFGNDYEKILNELKSN